MKFTQTNLPKSFRAYETLTICSNTLTGGGHIASVGEVLPLIVGKGEKPQIWLQAIVNPEKKEFVTIVENSVSKHPAVKVSETDGTIQVLIQGTTVLSAKQASENSAVVDEMDLRPIGLNLHGNQDAMYVGNSTFSHNSMQGGGILLGLGG